MLDYLVYAKKHFIKAKGLEQESWLQISFKLASNQLQNC